jgi:hypothetical protein
LPFDCITGIYFGINNDFSDTSNEKSTWCNIKSFTDKKYTYYDNLISLIRESNHTIELYKATPDLKNYEINFEKYL